MTTQIRSELVLSSGVGLVATLVDLYALTALVELFGWSAQQANVPALLLGACAQFVGSRYLVFQAQAGSWLAQGAGFSIVELGTLALNGLLFSLFVNIAPYPLARLVSTALVFVAFSFPLWRCVFRRSVNQQT